jgi:halocyanin-like protein
MSDVGNYDGVVDQTGSGEVTVTVGAEGNGGNFAFGPAAVQVDPGTTVVWEWNGEGGQHNVVTEEGGDFESELSSEAGFTFEQTLEEEGVIKYFCQPHRALGMKAVVVVGDAVPDGAEVVSGGGGGGGGSGGEGSGGGDGGGGGGEGSGSGSSGDSPASNVMSLMIGGSLVAAFLSPIVFGIVLMLRNKTGGPPEETAAEHGEPSHED